MLHPACAALRPDAVLTYLCRDFYCRAMTISAQSRLRLFPCEAVIARDVLHEEPAAAALHELDAESIQTGERGLGGGDQRDVPSAVHVGEQSAVRERDLDDSRRSSPPPACLHPNAQPNIPSNLDWGPFPASGRRGRSGDT